MAIKLEHVNYIYDADTELSVAALKDVCISIEDGQFIGLIGHTGSCLLYTSPSPRDRG